MHWRQTARSPVVQSFCSSYEMRGKRTQPFAQGFSISASRLLVAVIDLAALSSSDSDFPDLKNRMLVVLIFTGERAIA